MVIISCIAQSSPKPKSHLGIPEIASFIGGETEA